jgi:dihydrofolate reductase
MRRVIFQNLISLDGYFEGPKREIDWHNVDSEFNDYAIDFLNSVDTLLFGRVTYELMASYWPTEDAITNDPVVAEKMNSLTKFVFSKTLKKVNWNNTTLINEDIAEKVEKLKKSQGRDIAIFGSSDLALALIPSGLIDELSIMINPIILGKGKTIFRGINSRLNLTLVRTKIFRSGNVLLCYEPVNKPEYPNYDLQKYAHIS